MTTNDEPLRVSQVERGARALYAKLNDRPMAAKWRMLGEAERKAWREYAAAAILGARPSPHVEEWPEEWGVELSVSDVVQEKYEARRKEVDAAYTHADVITDAMVREAVQAYEKDSVRQCFSDGDELFNRERAMREALGAALACPLAHRRELEKGLRDDPNIIVTCPKLYRVYVTDSGKRLAKTVYRYADNAMDATDDAPPDMQAWARSAFARLNAEEVEL